MRGNARNEISKAGMRNALNLPASGMRMAFIASITFVFFKIETADNKIRMLINIMPAAFKPLNGRNNMAANREIRIGFIPFLL